MPIITTLVTTRSPLPSPPTARPPAVPSDARSANSAMRSWPMISPVVRLREKPCLPVEQKRQLTAHPACDDTHSVPRVSSGMYTVSTALLLPTSISHLRVPSGAKLSLELPRIDIVARHLAL